MKRGKDDREVIACRSMIATASRKAARARLIPWAAWVCFVSARRR